MHTYKALHEEAPRYVSDMLTGYQPRRTLQGLEHLAKTKENNRVQQPNYGMHSQLTFVNPKH